MSDEEIVKVTTEKEAQDDFVTRITGELKDSNKPPVFALLPIPILSFSVMALFFLVSTILSIVILSKGDTTNGIIILLLNIFGTLVVYFIGYAIYLAIFAAAVTAMPPSTPF